MHFTICFVAQPTFLALLDNLSPLFLPIFIARLQYLSHYTPLSPFSLTICFALFQVLGVFSHFSSLLYRRGVIGRLLSFYMLCHVLSDSTWHYFRLYCIFSFCSAWCKTVGWFTLTLRRGVIGRLRILSKNNAECPTRILKSYKDTPHGPSGET